MLSIVKRSRLYTIKSKVQVVPYEVPKSVSNMVYYGYYMIKSEPRGSAQS